MRLPIRLFLLCTVSCLAACGGSSKPSPAPQPNNTPAVNTTPQPTTPPATNTLRVTSTLPELPEAGQIRTAGNHCLDINGRDLFKSAGGRVQLWRCNRSANQQWWLTNNRLVNAGGRCLAMNNGRVESTNCSKDNSQKWQLVNNNVLMHSSNQCLGVVEDKSGGQLQGMSCHGQSGQQWTFSKTSRTGRMQIGSGFCLDINGPDLFNSTGGKVQTWSCNTSANQRWWLTEDRLVSAGGRCLTVSGTQVKSVDCRKADEQKWGINSGVLMNANKKCLEIPEANLNNRGSAAQIGDCNNHSGQRWRYEGSGVGNSQLATAPVSFGNVTKQPEAPAPEPVTPTAETPTTPVAEKPVPEPEPAPAPMPAAAAEPEGVFNGIVAAHNAFRTEVGVAPLQWSASIAAYAQEWADHLKANENCALKHRGAGRLYGENIAGGGVVSPQVAVRLWGGEKAFYDGTTHACQAGQVCGHYTQIVWRSTTELGCGMASCGGISVLVCSYSPPGNYRGQNPY
ncbi:MAG: ricin-type beta-trefoil lectin domain protein [Pseudomonadota bacterium]